MWTIFHAIIPIKQVSIVSIPVARQPSHSQFFQKMSRKISSQQRQLLIDQAVALNEEFDKISNRKEIDQLEESISEVNYANTRLLVCRTIALCICMLTHSYLLISVFPYSGFLAIHLLHLQGESEDSAAPYAGLISASFMAGRAVFAFFWGRIADRYGRLFVLYVSLGLSAVLSVFFGLASHSYVSALGIRFLLGCSNGIVSAVKTIVSEISDHETEAKVMNIVLGMWGLGFLISPAISGILSEPVRQYPGRDWENALGETLMEYPFILPNIVGAAFCLLSLVLVATLPETLPVNQRKNLQDDTRLVLSRMLPTCFRYAIVRPEATTSFPQENVEAIHSPGEETASIFDMISNAEIRRCLVVNWAFSFVALTVDESFPLFCLSNRAGFGIPEKEIGKVLSTCGLFFVVFQYWVYNWLHNRFGIYGSIKASLFISSPVMFLMPLSLVLNEGAETGSLNWVTFFFMATALAIFRCCSGAFYTSISVAANRSVTASNRAALNGLTMLGGSITKGLGPLMSGFLVSFSVSLFGSSAGTSIFAIISTFNTMVFVLSLYYFPMNDSSAIDEMSNIEMVK